MHHHEHLGLPQHITGDRHRRAVIDGDSGIVAHEYLLRCVPALVLEHHLQDLGVEGVLLQIHLPAEHALEAQHLILGTVRHIQWRVKQRFTGNPTR